MRGSISFAVLQNRSAFAGTVTCKGASFLFSFNSAKAFVYPSERGRLSLPKNGGAMPYVSLELEKSDARLTINGEPEPQCRLNWRISFSDPFDEVTLSNGKKLSEMPGALFLRPSRKVGDDREAIGAMHFLEAYGGSSDGVVRPSPDQYSVELFVSPAIIRDLFELERQGSGPLEATIEVPDLNYDWAPDGSAMKWEIDGSRNWLAVHSITFGFPCAEEEDNPEIELDKEPMVDATVLAIRDLTGQVNELARKLTQATPWLIAGLAAVVIATLFR